MPSTGRRREELRRRSLILQSVLRQVGDAAIVVDRDGKVLLFSPSVERLIGAIRIGDSVEDWPGEGRVSCLTPLRCTPRKICLSARCEAGRSSTRKFISSRRVIDQAIG